VLGDAAALNGAAVIVSPGTRVVVSSSVVVKTVPFDVVLQKNKKKKNKKKARELNEIAETGQGIHTAWELVKPS
jgi:hypothetical protein